MADLAAQPRLLRYAEISGALGIRVTAADQFDDALSAAAARNGTALIEVIADAELV